MENRTYFPLSLSQLNIRAVEQSCPGTSVNIIGSSLRIHGRFDPLVLQQSVDAVFRVDASLRTRITLIDGEPQQYHAEYEKPDFPLYDFSMSGPEGLENWENSVTREPIPLYDAPLCRFFLFRLGEQDGGLFVKLHHIISDGWSQVLLCNRIGQLYLNMLGGDGSGLEVPPDYEVYVRDEEEYLGSSAFARDKAYWKNILDRAGEPSAIKTVNGAAVSHVGNRKSYLLPQSLNNKIYTFCMQNRLSPFSVLYLALAVYFRRIGGANRFTIGVPVFNRSSYAFKQTSGMFVSTLPFFSELDGKWTMAECCQAMTEQWLELLRHQRMPFSQIQELAAERSGSAAPLFNIVLSYQNGQMLTSRDASVSFSGRWHYCGYQMEQLCIHLNNLEDDRRYAIDYDYLTQVFTEQEIDALHTCLMNILNEGLENPDKPICTLPVLSAQEKEKVLYTFNNTDTILYDNDLYDRFRRTVISHPDRAAVIHAGRRTTYAMLEKTAESLQAALAELVSAPCLAAVMLPREPMLLAAMMGILRGGSAFLLLPPDLPENRVRQILQSSEAAVLFTDKANAKRFGSGDFPPALICVEDVKDAASEITPADQDSPAYVVYTSGSTGTPKGVEVSRRSLLNLATAMQPVYGKGAVLSLCSIGFDAFLLESAAALLNGQTVLFPEAGETERPDRLADLILGYGVGFLSTTPSRLDALMKHPAFRSALKRIESIVCGGEPFPAHLLHQLQTVTDARIYNQYGPSEATVAVSMKLLNQAELITVGTPLQNCRLYVLDEWRNPLPVGIYGTLYIGGTCVGLGYRNMPEMTRQRFIESPFRQGERLYDTGDIACWTEDGEIRLGGRADAQVKLRGLRIEPDEAAACLRRHPQVEQCAVCVREIGGQAALVAYYVSGEPIAETELRAFSASYLPWYMVPAALLRVPEIPLTANGKVNEKLLPEPDASVPTGSGAASNSEKAVLEIFSRVLGRQDLNADSDYFLCGGNSLNAMETVGAVGEAFGCTLKISDMYVFRTARQIAAMLDSQCPELAPSPRLSAAPVTDRYPLSPVQQGIYVQSCMDLSGVAYQMPGAFVLPGKPDIDRLRAALRALVRSDKLLRTAFVQESDGVFARIVPDAELNLEVLHDAVFEDACADILAPFALDSAPLMRAKLLECSGEWTLLVNVHHIIGDGLTTPILMHRLDELYQGKVPEISELSYLDYAWQRSGEPGDTGRLDYWKDVLRDFPEPMELPADFKRLQNFDYSGGSFSFALGKSLSDGCGDFCRRLGISEYTLMLGAFGLVLSHLAGKNDLIVGAPAAGRTIPETREMCGPFINTLPLRLKVAPETSVREYLLSVRDAVNGMLDHQYVGLEEISSALGLSRSLTQSPLFSVMFTQRPLDADTFTLGGQKLVYRPVPTGTAKMDLVVELSRDEGGCILNAEYASSLFERESVAYWCRCMAQALRSMLRSEDGTLGSVCCLSPEDRIALIDTPEHTVVPFLDLPIHRVFEQQSELDPDATALIFHDRSYSRAELDAMACRIANLLTEAGVCPGTGVGLALERGPALAAAMLGILKAGCAYVPLMVSLPEQRLRYMIETANITHVICSAYSLKKLPAGLPCTFVDADGEADSNFETRSVKGSDLCNILFTSGSTGRPKGVMLVHRSVANMFLSIRAQLERSSGPILCTTNIGFDTFVTETLLSFAIGKPVILCDEEEMMLPWKLAELIRKYGVEYVQFTPARFQMLLSNDRFCEAAANLKFIMFGGEVVTSQLCEKTRSVTDATIINMYGPTEATVYITMTDLRPDEPITIGKPLKNGRLYVLNDAGERVLPTACGELWIAGEVLSLGYASNPELTEIMFRPDPFFPGEKMYRTGDIVRQKLNGCYDFLGRRDNQVKLNGQRVELDEITGAVIDSGYALLAATVPVRHQDMSMHLCTFYQPNPANPGNIDDLVRYLKTVLPSYMIPSRIVPLEEMPYTPSSKIDIRTLGELAVAGDSTAVSESAPAGGSIAQYAPEALSEETPASENSLESTLKSIWSRILGRTELRCDLSFFDQGGTSLAALSVLSQYHNCGLIMTMQQFYENPSLNAQCALLRGTSAAPARTEVSVPEAVPQPAPAVHRSPATVPSVKSAARVTPFCTPRPIPHTVASHAVRPAVRAIPVRGVKPAERKKNAAFLTGATGFMGAHLLRALVEDGERVLCLLRGNLPDRLWDTLCLYFGSTWVDDYRDAIEIVSGDITKPCFGLSEGAYRRLCGRIGTVWHCAADVRHYAADEKEFFAVNLSGTENAVRLARDSGAALYHMSTASVSGNRLRGCDAAAVFTENDFDIGQDWDNNIYLKSKYLAEKAVFDAIRGGLNARIFRLGRLVGRRSDGTFQKKPETNAFWLMLRGIHALGVLPEDMADFPIELTPVDWAAAAITALKNAPRSVYHIFSPAEYTMEQAARAVCPGLRLVSSEEFDARLAQALRRDARGLLAPLVDFRLQLLSAPPTVTVSNAVTLALLRSSGLDRCAAEPRLILQAFHYPEDECFY